MRKKILIVIGIVLAALLVLPFILPPNYRGISPQSLADPGGHFVDVNGLQTYVMEQGPEDGEVLLFLHGFGGATISWERSLEFFAAAGYRAVAFDLPPFGLTEKRADMDFSHPAQAAFTAALMDVLDIESATLFGHSMGTSVMLHFAAAYPERVARLVIVDGAVNISSGPGFLSGLLHFPPLARWMEIILSNVPPDQLTGLLDAAFYDPDYITPELRAKYTRALTVDNWAGGLVGLTRDAGRSSIPQEQLQAISAPMLIIWGEEDAVIGVERGQQLLNIFPDALWVAYPQVGHNPMEENADQFNEDVLAFLQRP